VSDAERDLLFRLAGHATPGLGLVSSRITPSVQRLLDRLANTPVAVFDATWTLVVANSPYDALMGPTTSWRNLIGLGTRAVHTLEERAESEAQLVADLRLTAARLLAVLTRSEAASACGPPATTTACLATDVATCAAAAGFGADR
jgi:hypothetical protein